MSANDKSVETFLRGGPFSPVLIINAFIVNKVILQRTLKFYFSLS